MKKTLKSRFDLKQLLQIAFDTKRKNNKMLLPIMFDIVVSSFKYDMSYKEYRIYEFYKLEKVDRRKFLMMSDAQRIDARYNHGINREIFTDKMIFTKRLEDYTGRIVLDLQTSGQTRFNDFIKMNHKYVAKQLGDNRGVKYFELDEETDKTALRESLVKDAYFLVEPFIVQHTELEKLYPASVNTLRVLTFVDEDLEVQVLNTALKVGNGLSRDNFSRGGLFSVPDENGTIIRPFVNKLGNIYETHPITNELLMGFEIPFYHQAVELCKRTALEVAGIRYVGWDVAITDEGVVLLDGSLYSKFFQIPPSVSAFVGEEIHDLRGTYSKYMDLKR